MKSVDAVLSFVRSECQRLGIDSSAYGVGDDFVSGLGEYIFSFRDGKWVVFLYERGKESDFAIFDRAFDAIRFFFLTLCIDNNNYIMPKIDFKNMPEA